MTLTPGSRIGPYEISSLIGAGGMGEVFRAVDVNLGRAAAIKVLPASLAGDPERLLRFEREAQTLASLNHPNIAQVFGFEKGEGSSRALAMEFVEGLTLAERINGMAMPVDEALAVAAQIADGLESAHDHGIIHRDLKPLNIKVRPDGTVKILDFGLAKALTPSVESSSGLLANSPTITSPAMTHAGVVLGTAAYMSPEQAKGRVVDRRADIWAFGCVLFEMLTGKRAFVGSDVSEVFVAILRDEPKWSALPADTPAHVQSLLRRCLQKDVRKRLPHIGVARLELAEPPGTDVNNAAHARRRTAWRYAAAAAMVAVIGVPSWLLWRDRGIPPPAPPIHLRIDLGMGAAPLAGGVAIGPDGRVAAMTARPTADAAGTQIYLRSLDRLDAQPLAGTEGGASPIFSPDGRWIAFFADGALKKVSVNGGPTVTICPAPGQRGAWWGVDDTIVFATGAGISRVSASGGTPQLVLPVTEGQPAPASPQVLPGGVVLYAQSFNSDPVVGTLYVRDLAGGPAKAILEGGRFPRYLESGHLTFVRGGTMFAVPFDVDTLTVRGEPIPVLEGVFQAPFSAVANLSVSANGTLMYQGGAAISSRQAPIMWLTETGALAPLRALPASWAFPRFSPDGTRLAMAITDGRASDIWVYDWNRDILTRITNDPGAEVGPVWTPDGVGLVYSATRGANVLNVYWQRADGTGTFERLTTSTMSQIPGGFDPEGKRLVFHEGDPSSGRQTLTMLPIERDASGRLTGGTPSVLIGGPFLKSNPRISRDGKWIAYAANDTGTYEIYVQPFPGLGERVQVSNGGGNLALWSPVKNELHYAGAGQTRLMVVPYHTSGDRFVPTKPRQWSQTPFSPAPPVAVYGPAFDVHADGHRFAVSPPLQALPDASGREAQFLVIFNFFDELRRRAPIR